MYRPIVRIALRYGAGMIFSAAVGDMLASDPDVVNVCAAALSGVVGAVVEHAYKKARNTGGEL